MFRGNIPAKIDEKGRLKMPVAFKLLLDAANDTQFYITSVDGKKAEIWPLSVWEKREMKLLRSSTMNDAVEKYLSLTSYFGQQVEMDNQGRMLMPQILRTTGKLDAEVAVMGTIDHLVVQNLAEADESVSTNKLTAEDRRAVNALISEEEAS
jgi:MraZ protein